uniref:Putative 2'-deoxynucleoside 5'-phosphate N-hydrolase 1 n=1 Tax=Ciona intestinalis TaxID=7719 RepID=F6Y8H0_CIOIN|nr:2'-deoxynucleoside 5'-phosphate N-hydrolase 1-like [Ciona intestinalis]|eukprot:XP_002120773.1 2'-deoxynucleoside 5'-phosphate N-hydrolase 1-like [Ciona intestinalis]
MNENCIYFCGSIRGGRDDAEIYRQLISHLQTYGKVLTEHIGSTEVNEKGIIKEDVGRTDKEIHDRDIEWLEYAKVVVAEVTQPSLGVGYELGRAVAMGKQILCLFRPSPDKRLSAMIEGAKNGDNFRVVHYNNVEDGCLAISSYMKSLCNV